MGEICPVCGLPKEICTCQLAAIKEQKITVSVEEGRYRKKVTVISGIDESQVDLKSLTKKLKHALACGGSFKDGKILLQGDHRNKIKKLLAAEGFKEDNIEIV